VRLCEAYALSVGLAFALLFEFYDLRTSPGSLAIFIAIRRALSRSLPRWIGAETF
jgi:hypothetical protein